MTNDQRPDGSIATPIGWCLILLGLVGAFVGASAETINGLVIGLTLANLGFGLGVLLLSLGYLVRAIWFLPGRDLPQIQSEQSVATPRQCDWCGRTPAAGTACSHIAHENLVQISSKITSPVCQEKLAEHNYEIAR